MPNVWSRVAAFTHKYPLSRGMLSYACIWPLGSCVQQKIQGKEKLDYWRALRFSLYGCCFVAPTLYTWMTIAGYLFPKPGLRSGIYKALVEQVSYTPSAMICFYFFMTLLEGGTLDEACEEVKTKFLPTYKVGACVWPVLQTFNFTVVPPQNRVPFVSLCSLCWTTFLAYMKQLESQQLEKPMTVVAPSLSAPFTAY
ncbi:mpv17-like protein isoform X1 [Thrips palmi]|uniref:Mpv17-like protein isoform X1 n=1 Tax=Thrips palmi TaxID=161013 RepID=A0A6P9AEZ1_THRPL|nr:mpv17-like protein isoform X1 [Thrips palmi]